MARGAHQHNVQRTLQKETSPSNKSLHIKIKLHRNKKIKAHKPQQKQHKIKAISKTNKNQKAVASSVRGSGGVACM